MKVLHYQHMGVGVILSEAMNAMGVTSRVLATDPHPFGFVEDELVPVGNTPFTLARRALVWSRYASYDVFHNHGEVPPRAATRWSGRLVQHYHAPSITRRAESAAIELVSLPGLLQQVPGAVWIPLPARTEMFRPDLRIPSEQVRIGYCVQRFDPNKPRMIPVEEIEAAIAKSGGRAVARPLDGVILQADMPAYYADIDIWVDRIGAGFYGFSSIEAAAMGLPVVTEIGAFERSFVPSCPFVNTTRERLADVLIELVRDERSREELGRLSREYILEVHEVNRVVRQCIEMYEELITEAK